MADDKVYDFPMKPILSNESVTISMIDIERIIRQRDIHRAKTELSKMLAVLSDEALEYVWRPIAYAYYWTDDHDMELLSEDDSNRYGLIGAAAHDSPEDVRALNDYRCALFRMELAKWREQRRGKSD